MRAPKIENSRALRNPPAVVTLKEYLEKLARLPAIAPLREPKRRESCERCDGEVFLISTAGCAICAGCGTALVRRAHRRSPLCLDFP